jgi:hypothetical protein
MNVDVFLPYDPAPQPVIERLLVSYANLVRVRWHGPDAGGLYRQLCLASFPLDASTGHSGPGEQPGLANSYGYYGYGGEDHGVALPAIAIFDRLAIVPAIGGEPKQVRQGVWTTPFQNEQLLRGSLHQALEAAFTELREAHRALTARRGAPIRDEAAAVMLDVNVSALRRALYRS